MSGVLVSVSLRCLVHPCREPARHWLLALDVQWPSCPQHRDDVAALLATANPVKESR